MKKPNLRSFLLLTAGALALAVGPWPALAGTPELPDAGLRREIKSTSYEHRDEFITAVIDATTRLDSRIADLQARAAGKPSSEARIRAMEDLKTARSDLAEKIGAFSNASAETWNSVRDQALSALNRVQSTCESVQAL